MKKNLQLRHISYGTVIQQYSFKGQYIWQELELEPELKINNFGSATLPKSNPNFRDTYNTKCTGKRYTT